MPIAMTPNRLAGGTALVLFAGLFLGLAVASDASTVGESRNDDAASQPAESPLPVRSEAGASVPVNTSEDNHDREATVTRLRYEAPVFPVSLRFTGTSRSTVRIDAGRKPQTLNPRVSATSDVEVRPLGRDEGRNRVGFAILGLSFHYRDEKHSLAFSLGEGRGPEGEDGLSTSVDGVADQPIPELDWGGGATELPPSFGEIVATGRLSRSAGLQNIANRLPDAAQAVVDETDDARASLLVYQSPAEVAALYFLPLPSASLESLADEEGKATWRATVSLPPLYGEDARDVELRFRADTGTIANDDWINVTFEPADESALPEGQTLTGRMTINHSEPDEPHTVAYKLSHKHADEHHETTWRIAPH